MGVCNHVMASVDVFYMIVICNTCDQLSVSSEKKIHIVHHYYAYIRVLTQKTTMSMEMTAWLRVILSSSWDVWLSVLNVVQLIHLSAALLLTVTEGEGSRVQVPCWTGKLGQWPQWSAWRWVQLGWSEWCHSWRKRRGEYHQCDPRRSAPLCVPPAAKDLQRE